MKNLNMQYIAPRAFCLSLVVVLLGCSGSRDNRGAIHGQVKHDGQPIEHGAIVILPIEGTQGAVSGGQIENGRYHIAGKDGPAVGWNRVEIRAVRKTGKMVQRPLSPPGEMIEESVDVDIPARFNSASTLKVEIKPGDNTADFDVNSK